MKKSITMLRISYWWGIIADTVVALFMFKPDFFQNFMKIEHKLSDDFGFGLRYGLPLMLGWIVLLLWANCKPVERKDILLITLAPVVIGYMVFQIYCIRSGYATFKSNLPTFILQIAMSSMFIYSYNSCNRNERN